MRRLSGAHVDLRFARQAVRDARGVAAIARRRREDLAARDERDLPAVRRERELLETRWSATDVPSPGRSTRRDA